jgi:hypothetical protein
MKNFISVIKNSYANVKTLDQKASVTCNYADNYYGDQVCLLKHKK